MQIIVITGSTRGIGYGLADAFLGLGCAVTISGRTSASVEEAVKALCTKHDAKRMFGHPCDVTDFGQVQALWDTAKSRWGRIDIWINNAGIAHPQLEFSEHTPERIQTVIETNLVGTMYGGKVALSGMQEQGFGSLYNMEGLGSDGRKVKGMTLYGSSKCAIKYLTDAWAQETQRTSVRVGALRPGMVITDLLTGQFEGRPDDWERAKRVFNILADRVETVTPWLAQRVLANNRNGVHISWLTRRRAMGRFLTSPFRKRDLLE